MRRREFLQGFASFSTLLVLQRPVCAAKNLVFDDADADSVAVYSELLARAGANLDADEQFGLAARTFAATAPVLRVEGAEVQGESARDAGGDLVPVITSPADMAPTIQHMVADLVKIGRQPRTIPRGVTMPRSCLLMTAEEVRDFYAHATGATWNAKPVQEGASPLTKISRRIQHVKFVVSYSDIVFNADHSLSLVALGDGEGPSRKFVILGKTKSEWHPLDWDIEGIVVSS